MRSCKTRLAGNRMAIDPFAFEKFVDLGIGEAGVGAEIDARQLAAITGHDRLQQASHPSALCTLPGRKAQRSRSPNWLNTNSG